MCIKNIPKRLQNDLKEELKDTRNATIWHAIHHFLLVLCSKTSTWCTVSDITIFSVQVAVCTVALISPSVSIKQLNLLLQLTCIHSVVVTTCYISAGV